MIYREQFDSVFGGKVTLNKDMIQTSLNLNHPKTSLILTFFSQLAYKVGFKWRNQYIVQSYDLGEADVRDSEQ